MAGLGARQDDRRLFVALPGSGSVDAKLDVPSVALVGRWPFGMVLMGDLQAGACWGMPMLCPDQPSEILRRCFNSSSLLRAALSDAAHLLGIAHHSPLHPARPFPRRR